MFLVKSFLNYSNGHSDLYFLTLAAKMYTVETVNIIISKNRIFVFFLRFFCIFRFSQYRSRFRFFKISRYSVSVSVTYSALLSSGAVCLGLILLALYQVPHSVNVLSSARRVQTSTTRCSFNGTRCSQ